MLSTKGVPLWRDATVGLGVGLFLGSQDAVQTEKMDRGIVDTAISGFFQHFSMSSCYEGAFSLKVTETLALMR